MNSSIYWSLLAGICTVAGSILLFVRQNWSRKSLAFFLGLASGVMIAVVIFDLLPSALLFPGRVKAILGFLMVIPIMIYIDSSILKRVGGQRSLRSLGYLIMLGIALHDLPEGMAIAFGDEMKSNTGLIIAIGIGIHNIPEGMAMAAPLLMGGVKRSKILARTFLIGLITPLGTIIGKYTAAIFPELLSFMLGLAAGVMVFLVISQLWPQATRNDKRSRWWGLILGIIIILVATFL